MGIHLHSAKDGWPVFNFSNPAAVGEMSEDNK